MAAKKEETQQACASCKHQRKKCKREICPLAPFFPAERTREFEAVQKVFGVSNAQKMIQAVDTREEQFIVAESLIWEATCRLRDPKHGCSADYKRLQAEKNKLQLLVHSLEKQNQELLRLQISKNMQCFHNNVPQQNQSLMKITYDNFNYIESGLIGTSNNDLINRIDFGSLAHSSIQHNEDYSFTGKSRFKFFSALVLFLFFFSFSPFTIDVFYFLPFFYFFFRSTLHSSENQCGVDESVQ